MKSDRVIGRTVTVRTYQAQVELSPDTGSYVKSSFGGLYAIGVINSFVIIPVGSERLVAIVTSLDLTEEGSGQGRQQPPLVIAKARRTMWVSMVGTITQSATGSKTFEYGIKRYPELDNPVWFASESDLDVIFDEASRYKAERITIGRSPIFSDYSVSIDIDRFFGKHAAILGNTGSGKSCTVTAILKAVLARDMPNAHFVIFDTNNEYEQAFTSTNGQKLFNRLVLRNRGDVPVGLTIPHWFMNSADYHAFFRPAEGAQAPLLFKAIRSARAHGGGLEALGDALAQLDLDASRLDNFLSSPPTGNGIAFGRKNAREMVDGIRAYVAARAAVLGAGSGDYARLLVTLRTQVATDGQLTSADFDAIRIAAREIRDLIARDRTQLGSRELVGVDNPSHFDFDTFVTDVFEAELARESQKDPRLRTYVGTLQLRLEQARGDPRYAFLFRAKPFGNALASFLRLVLGIDPAHNFDSDPPPWANAYREQFEPAQGSHQVTILDLSELASDVLENVTALLGRLVLDFMQRLPERASVPVVLVLEEAHRYIPDHAPLERQMRAREVFEKIAKEGRKFGLSLVVASQRPSELSRTVLAQCNSFIVHRIQNPDDQEYFKSVVSGVSRELLDQLPGLAQQQAIVMGDCVTLPLQVRINRVDPRPRSLDPEFVRIWSDPNAVPPDVEAVTRRWEGEAEPPTSDRGTSADSSDEGPPVDSEPKPDDVPF